jgi:hypothetical protein
METLAHLSRKQQYPSISCKDISWFDALSFLSSPDAQVEGLRSWLWQTCTEVGFYQTCHENSTCPFGRGYHNLDMDFEICKEAFGVEEEWVVQNVEDTLNYYGGWDMKGSRILSVNGDIDPWSAMSMNMVDKEGQQDLPTYWSEGASHHFWTHEILDTDGEKIMQTREFIYRWVTQVLQNDGKNFDSNQLLRVSTE